MKIYKIVDEFMGTVPIAYLCYYEKSRSFSIEISPEVSANDLPIFFAGFASGNVMSIDLEWSKRWVKERIVPEDRQNLGSILRDNKIKDYDLMKLLETARGRSSQDDCAILPADPETMPLWFAERQSRKVRSVFPLTGNRIMISFHDGKSFIMDLTERIAEDRSFKTLDKNKDLFDSVSVQPGGNGVCWNDWLYISACELYGEGKRIEISADEIRSMIEREAVDTQAVCAELSCSRQYVDKLVRDGKLEAIQGEGKARLYFRSDVERLKW